MKNILITGYKGFLGGNLIEYMISKGSYQFYYYNHDVRELVIPDFDIDTIFHFASPSDSFEFKDKEKTASTIIEGTINMVKIAKIKNAKLVFASSEASLNPNNNYGIFKLAMEKFIESNLSNYQILVIPRVYGKDRNKGLMKKLRQNLFTGDKNQEIEYLDIHAFLEETYKMLLTDKKYILYNNKLKDTINKIEEKYI